jgi:hypothetical protein
MEKKKHGIKKIFRNILIVAVVIVLAFFGGILYSRKKGTKSTTVTQSTLKETLVNISDLASVEYNYTKMGKYSNSLTINGWSIPFTQKSFILSYDGTIKAGYNLKNAKITVSGSKITVTLPKAKVLSHEIEESSIKVYDETNGLFNTISVKNYKTFATKAKKTAQSEAIKKGLYTKAYNNASSIIKKTIQLISSDYQVTVKQSE